MQSQSKRLPTNQQNQVETDESVRNTYDQTDQGRLGNFAIQEQMRLDAGGTAPLPPGPYYGKQRPNAVMDPLIYIRNLFKAPIFKAYRPSSTEWLPLDSLLEAAFRAGGPLPRITNPEHADALWQMLEVRDPQFRDIHERKAKQFGRLLVAEDLLQIYFSRDFKVAHNLAMQAWLSDDKMFAHEWLALRFGFVPPTTAYWAKGSGTSSMPDDTIFAALAIPEKQMG